MIVEQNLVYVFESHFPAKFIIKQWKYNFFLFKVLQTIARAKSSSFTVEKIKNSNILNSHKFATLYR